MGDFAMFVELVLRQMHKLDQLKERMKKVDLPSPEIIVGAVDQIYDIYVDLLEKARTDPSSLGNKKELAESVLGLQESFEECERLISIREEQQREEENWGLFDGTNYEN